MKLECLQENLAEGLTVVGRVVPTKSTLPVLSNVLLSTRDGELQLTAKVRAADVSRLEAQGIRGTTATAKRDTADTRQRH